MKYDSEKHNRRSIRLRGYDYSESGVYFVTICTHNMECIFGEIINGEMHLNENGRIVDIEWAKTNDKRNNVVLDTYVVMPNHFHGIVILIDTCGGTARCAPTTKTCNGRNYRKFGKMISGTLPAIIRSFKSAVTKHINELRSEQGVPVWQRNYYEHIIINEKELNQIREYVISNQLGWELDEENPKNWEGKSIINKTILQ